MDSRCDMTGGERSKPQTTIWKDFKNKPSCMTAQGDSIISSRFYLPRLEALVALDRWMHLPLLIAFWGDQRPLLSLAGFQVLKCKIKNENAQQRNSQFPRFYFSPKVKKV
jgi:hypothetical protein